jgi:hypothetical protein
MFVCDGCKDIHAYSLRVISMKERGTFRYPRYHKMPTCTATHRSVVTMPMVLVPIVYLFSSVAYVWVRGAKTTGPITKKFVFSEI